MCSMSTNYYSNKILNSLDISLTQKNLLSNFYIKEQNASTGISQARSASSPRSYPSS